jgi:hypothetical protein
MTGVWDLSSGRFQAFKSVRLKSVFRLARGSRRRLLQGGNDQDSALALAGMGTAKEDIAGAGDIASGRNGFTK